MTVFDPQGAGADATDGLQHLAGQAVHGKPKTHLAAVADHAHMVAVEDVLALGAAGHEGLQEAIDGLGHALGLALARVGAERLGHRARLVHQEQETGGVGAADLGGVGHELLPSVW